MTVPADDASQVAEDLRIAVDGLRTGMFVSRLDRSWIGTGFPLEGALMRTAADVATLQGLCLYVHVDPRRGLAPDPRDLHDPGALVRHASGQDEVDALRRTEWPAAGDFAAELPEARDVFERFEHDLGHVMDAVRTGGSLDAAVLASGIDTLLDSITRNPSALPWVLELKRKGDYVYQHALGCSVWAATFGRHLGLEREDLRHLAMGALLCDVGKVRLPRTLLERQPPLREADFHRLRGHLAESVRIVSGTAGLAPMVLDMVAHHHERHDGSGYPRGLRGSAIPIHARIAGLIDTYDAMTAVRPYARTRSPHEAVMVLYDQRDQLFQAELVEQFIRACGIYPTGSLVELSNGAVAVVMEVHPLKRLRPRVMVLMDREKKLLPEFRMIDLADAVPSAVGASLSIATGLPPDAYGIDRSALFLD